MQLATRLIIEEALEAENRDILGRDYYAHGGQPGQGYRNGNRTGKLKTAEGAVAYTAPQIAGREEPYRSRIRSELKGNTERLETLAVELLARGLSVRDIEDVFRDEAGSLLMSRTAVSEIGERLWQDYQEFSKRDLGEYDVFYLFVDGIAERIRPGQKREAVLAAWGITCEGKKVLLALMAGSKEDTETVSAFFQDMRNRNLGDPLMVVSDGAAGVIKAIEVCFPRSLRQRCLAHSMRNLAAKVPEEQWPEFKECARAAYQAPSRAIWSSPERLLSFTCLFSRIYLPRSLRQSCVYARSMPDERDIDSPTQFRLHFEKAGDAVRRRELPASVLIQALSGVQRIVHLIALHHDQREIRTRARVTQGVMQRFPVMCQVPVSGSYELPVSIGTTAPGIGDPALIAAVAGLSHEVLEALSDGDLQRFRTLIPDLAYRKNISKAAKDAVPSPHTGYSFGVHNVGGRCIFNAHEALPHIEKVLRPENEFVEAKGVVTGRFIRVNFEARKLEILYPATNTMLDCLYHDDVEPLLLDNPRELIQVVGTVTLNAEGAPLRIADVRDILKVDLSPISVCQIPYEEGQLAARQPIKLAPTLSDTKQFYEVEHEALGISLIAHTRDELIEALSGQIAILWSEYAKEVDDNLTDGAQALKGRLLATFEERM